MSALKLFILAAVCAAASWYLFFNNNEAIFSTRHVISPSLKDELASGNLSSIHIAHPGEVYEISCNATKSCTLTDPKDEALEATEFEKFLTNIDSLTILSEISASEQQADGGDFGFSLAPLKLEIKASRRYIIYFGGKNPISQSRYLRIEGSSSLYTIADDVFTKLLVKKSALRQQKIAILDPEKMTLVEASSNNFSYRFSRNQQGWNFEQQQIDLDQTLLPEILQRLDKIKVIEFIDTPPPILLQQLAQPDLILNLSDDVGNKQRLSFYSVALPEHVAQREGLLKRLYFLAVAGKQTIFQILPPRLSDFNNPPLHFQSRTPFATLGDQAFDITVTSGNSAPRTLKSDDKALGKLVSTLQNIKLISTLGIAQQGQPSASVQIRRSDNTVAEFKLFQKLSSNSSSENDAPYNAEILYFSSTRVHAIISGNDAAAINKSIATILSEK